MVATRMVELASALGGTQISLAQPRCPLPAFCAAPIVGATCAVFLLLVCLDRITHRCNERRVPVEGGHLHSRHPLVILGLVRAACMNQGNRALFASHVAREVERAAAVRAHQVNVCVSGQQAVNAVLEQDKLSDPSLNRLRIPEIHTCDVLSCML